MTKYEKISKRVCGEMCKMANKTIRPKRKAPMEITTTARHSFEKCEIDSWSHNGNDVGE